MNKDTVVDFKFFQEKVYRVDRDLLRLYHDRIHLAYSGKYTFLTHVGTIECDKFNRLYTVTRNEIGSLGIDDYNEVREFYWWNLNDILSTMNIVVDNDIISDIHHQRMIPDNVNYL